MYSFSILRRIRYPMPSSVSIIETTMMLSPLLVSCTTTCITEKPDIPNQEAPSLRSPAMLFMKVKLLPLGSAATMRWDRTKVLRSDSSTLENRGSGSSPPSGGKTFIELVIISVGVGIELGKELKVLLGTFDGKEETAGSGAEEGKGKEGIPENDDVGFGLRASDGRMDGTSDGHMVGVAILSMLVGSGVFFFEDDLFLDLPPADFSPLQFFFLLHLSRLQRQPSLMHLPLPSSVQRAHFLGHMTQLVSSFCFRDFSLLV
mmetsp:Transcript_33873/g.62733  ORF Transcript_33873/g.62733 Transcript_33873/m.62733 type:complete len:260 (+) Transcript_33873:3459-4238(+)